MKRVGFWSLLALALLGAAAVQAGAVWKEHTVKDPLSGYEITVYKPADMTADIYNWPSRRDLVYWPHTDPYWIWHSPHTDYVSFGDDFDELSDEEKQRIRRYLKQNRLYTGEKTTLKKKLRQLEAIYKLRDKDEDFYRWFYRVMAHYYQDEPEKAEEYHAKLVPLLKKQLPVVDDGVERIKLLYLLGEYQWRLGKREEAKGYFSRARKVVWTDRKGQARTGIDYIDDLIEERLMTVLIEQYEEKERQKRDAQAKKGSVSRK